MKKIIYLLSITTALFFAFSINIYARTINVSELVQDARYEAGDIIYNDTSTQFNAWITPEAGTHIRINAGQSFTLPKSVFYNMDSIGQSFFYPNIIKNRRNLTINLTEGDSFTFNLSDVCDLEETEEYPFEIFVWYVTSVDRYNYVQSNGGGYQFANYESYTPSLTLNNISCHDLTCDSRFYGADSYLLFCEARHPRASVTHSSGRFIINLTHTEDHARPEQKDNDSESEKETEEEITPELPSTVPNNTAQVSTGTANKDFANIKVLNQYLHDSVNQKILADLYAAKLRKKANVLVQKNVIPPWGVDNKWKTTSHTVRWKDLNVKKGNTVMIVWYTPTFFGQGSTLKYITATVIEDGVIEFTAPAMGDMSVMSIVKLI